MMDNFINKVRAIFLGDQSLTKNTSSLPLTKNFSTILNDDLNGFCNHKTNANIFDDIEDSDLQDREEEVHLTDDMGFELENKHGVAPNTYLPVSKQSGSIIKTFDSTQIPEQDLPVHNTKNANIDNLTPIKTKPIRDVREETIKRVALQIVFPYFISGLGMVAAGVVLDRVQHWQVFEAVTELYILIPPLLGLKGNLEMTLASRISTQSNLGHVDTHKDYLRMAKGNLSLLQVQAICLGFYASVIALLIGFIPDGGTLNILHAQILLASCLITTTLASAILGILMIAVVYITRKYDLNPDNIATPLAASLGDLVTLGILALISRSLFKYASIYYWLCIPIILAYLLFIPLWFFVCRKNHFVKTVLMTGWTPILASMTISSLGGLILDYTVRRFNGIAVYQPIINGLGGNLVAIQASRLSTDFHKLGPPGTLGADASAPPGRQSAIPSQSTHRDRQNISIEDGLARFRAPESIPTSSNDDTPLSEKSRIQNGFYNSSYSNGTDKIESNGTLVLDKIESNGHIKHIENGHANANFSDLKSPKPYKNFNESNNDSPIVQTPFMNPATYNICRTFCSTAFNSRMARLLLYLALPGHVLFLFLISYIKNGKSTITLNFALFYLASALLQVITLLYLANVLILTMWRRRTDPDNAAIPYLTAIGDFLGIGLLSLSFFALYSINPKDPNLDVG